MYDGKTESPTQCEYKPCGARKYKRVKRAAYIGWAFEQAFKWVARTNKLLTQAQQRNKEWAVPGLGM